MMTIRSGGTEMENKNKGLLAYILVCILWGSTYLAIRIGVHSFPPFLFGGFRCLIAGSLILLYGYKEAGVSKG